MSGFFGVASKEDCIFDLFFGTDYHSHLGTRRAGMTVYHQKEGFHRAIHNIENTPFRTKFDKDLNNLSGHLGIGCISDYEPQPLLIRSHHGTYAIMTIGKINNIDTIVDKIMNSSPTHFFELSGGEINATEAVAALINQKENLIERLKAKPKTFTFDDAESLLRYFGYERSNKGRTSGSRIVFVSEQYPPILMHKPHPRKELLEYQVKQLIQILEQEGLL